MKCLNLNTFLDWGLVSISSFNCSTCLVPSSFSGTATFTMKLHGFSNAKRGFFGILTFLTGHQEAERQAAGLSPSSQCWPPPALLPTPTFPGNSQWQVTCFLDIRTPVPALSVLREVESMLSFPLLVLSNNITMISQHWLSSSQGLVTENQLDPLLSQNP